MEDIANFFKNCITTNFAEETKFVIHQYYDSNLDDFSMVDFIKIVTDDNEYQITWENFLRVANFDYVPIDRIPNNRDSNECMINTHSVIDGLIFIVFKDGSYLRRSSTMDSWEYIPIIKKNEKFDTIYDRYVFKTIDRTSQNLMFNDLFYF